jgi:hypothetical protein
LRGLGVPLLALALSSAPHVGAAPQVELTPAWAGWSRPGRATEVAVQVRADATTRGAIEIASGAQSARAPVNLAAGESLRLEVPVASAESLEVTIDLDGAPRESRAQALSLSESPLLGLALASGEAARIEGFHSVPLVPADLPRGTAAYASMDALVLDAATLRALDPGQLGALIGHAAACGRIALVAPDAGAWRVLEGAAGCGARMLVSGDTLDAALRRLEDSLASPAATPPSASDLAALLRPEPTAWPRIVAALVAFFGIAALAVAFTASPAVLLLVPLLASAFLAALLHSWEPRPRLVVWAEAEPSARVAQYQAWHSMSGVARRRLDVPVLAGLAAPRACDRQRAVQLAVDPARAQPVTASFDSRLFEPVALCYSGNFPVMRALSVTPLDGDRLEVRNQGTLAWPAGQFLAGGSVQELPALNPGASATLSLADGQAPRDDATRAALARTPYDGYALLWSLQLDAVADAPAGAVAWLLVPVAGQT